MKGSVTLKIAKHALAAVLALAALLWAPPHAGAADEELQRTWGKAWVYAPAGNTAGYKKIDTGGLAAYLSSLPSAPQAVILYGHGCDGLSEISATTGRYLAQAGYLVVEPDSFARKDKPVSCQPVRHQGGLHRAVLAWRQAEIKYAFEQVEKITGLAGLPIILMGHSEGAITVATIGDLPAAGRIIEGWTCHAGWPEYRGLAAPPEQPVLAISSEKDPWFRDPELAGDCGVFMQGHAAQRSIVYREPNYLADKHWLSFDKDVQKIILDFIREATSR
jgi:dienelactone hydrolase